VSDGVGEDGMAAAADGAEQREETVDEIIRRADAPTIGATDVDRGAVTTPSGMQFDMEAFAREMFEQGYRQGYVSGLTQARTDAVRRMQERERAQQARAEMQREAERQRRTDAMQRGANGETVIILPPGVSPQEFLRSLAAQ
jgi:glycine/D-amino acid oxidase-like deaminating enzyme